MKIFVVLYPEPKWLYQQTVKIGIKDLVSSMRSDGLRILYEPLPLELT